MYSCVVLEFTTTQEGIDPYNFVQWTPMELPEPAIEKMFPRTPYQSKSWRRSDVFAVCATAAFDAEDKEGPDVYF